MGDLTDGEAQFVGRLGPVQVGAAGQGDQLGRPAGNVGPGLLGGVEGVGVVPMK